MFPVTTTAETAESAATAISPNPLAANRQNAELSTGPRTSAQAATRDAVVRGNGEAGKQRSRLNALRHKLTGQVAILPDEERHAAELFCRNFVDHYAPANLEERLLVRAIAEDYWRINRAHAVENNWFAIDISRRPADLMAGGHDQIENAVHMAKTFRENPWHFHLLTLYEQRAYRSLDRNLRRLEQARREFAARRAKALRDSVHLDYMYARLGRHFDLNAEARANGGFVFSSVEISAAREREKLLALEPEADLAQLTSAAA